MALGELRKSPRSAVYWSASARSAPTRIGEQVLVDARRLLVDLADLQTSARESRARTHRAIDGGLLQHLVANAAPAGILSQYVVRFPGVDLTFTEGPHDVLIDNLRNGTLDLALLYDYGSDLSAHRDDLDTEVIVAAPPYVLLHEEHPLAVHDSVALKQLVDHPMILFSLPPGGDYFLSLFKAEGLQPRVRYRATNFELVRSLVARRLGYSILGQRTKISVSYEGRGFTTRPLKGDHPRPCDQCGDTCGRQAHPAGCRVHRRPAAR